MDPLNVLVPLDDKYGHQCGKLSRLVCCTFRPAHCDMMMMSCSLVS